jgi:hypothetical protein
LSAIPIPTSPGYQPPAPKVWKTKLPIWRRFWRMKSGDKFLIILGGLLLGYALGGRGFAYWGFSPVYVGEMTLALGVFTIFKSGQLLRVLKMTIMLPLMLFMAWGACRTIPFLNTYGAMALRDAAIWGFGAFAFIVVAVLTQAPRRLLAALKYYRLFCYIFLFLAPITCLLCSSAFYEIIPNFPGTENAIIQVKGGDTCVHLAGTFAYISAMGSGINPWIAPIMIPINLGINLQGRGALLSFLVACVLTSLLLPFNNRSMRVYAVLALGLFGLWVTDLHFGQGQGEEGREFSFQFLETSVGNILGITQDKNLDATKQWRMNWWQDIVGYAVYGKYKWTGKGFGVNLADDDGYQLDGNLRSPHNGNMTVLARTGIPGVTLWGLTQFTWICAMAAGYLRARRRRDWKWTNLFIFLIVYWASFMTNASVDVFIEGPMGGIWLWVIYGTGIAALQIYKRDPQILYDQADWDRANDRAIAVAAQMGITSAPAWPHQHHLPAPSSVSVGIPQRRPRPLTLPPAPSR